MSRDQGVGEEQAYTVPFHLGTCFVMTASVQSQCYKVRPWLTGETTSRLRAMAVSALGAPGYESPRHPVWADFHHSFFKPCLLSWF